jgi:Domain of unknown function (DUF1707)
MAGPGDETTGQARGRGRLRASHADREQAIEVLKSAFVQGRLTKDEFDARVGQGFASRTYAELAAVTADLPVAPTVAQPRTAAQAEGWLTMKRAVTCSVGMVIAAVMATVIAWVLGSGPAFLLSVFAFIAATVAGGTMISEAWDKNKRRRSQLPPRSAQPGRALEGKQSSSPGDDLILCQARRGTAVGMSYRSGSVHVWLRCIARSREISFIQAIVLDPRTSTGT